MHVRASGYFTSRTRSHAHRLHEASARLSASDKRAMVCADRARTVEGVQAELKDLERHFVELLERKVDEEQLLGMRVHCLSKIQFVSTVDCNQQLYFLCVCLLKGSLPTIGVAESFNDKLRRFVSLIPLPSPHRDTDLVGAPSLPGVPTYKSDGRVTGYMASASSGRITRKRM